MAWLAAASSAPPTSAAGDAEELWGDGGSGADGDADAAARDGKARADALWAEGFRDAYDGAHKAALQPGFERGFYEGCRAGRAWGEAAGAGAALAALPQDLRGAAGPSAAAGSVAAVSPAAATYAFCSELVGDAARPAGGGCSGGDGDGSGGGGGDCGGGAHRLATAEDLRAAAATLEAELAALGVPVELPSAGSGARPAPRPHGAAAPGG